MQQSNCDIAICHGPRSMIIFAPAVRTSGIPLAMWVHGHKSGRHWLKWAVRRVPPDLAICNSLYSQQAAAALFPSTESAVVYAPIAGETAQLDETLRSEVRQEFNTPADAVVIVQASRMVPLKGHRLLIDMLASLRCEQSWRCWIVGGVQAGYEQAYFRQLRAQVRDRGLDDRVHFTGQRSDVARILASADLFCQPNQRPESFGVAFIEAMLAGLPVVTSASGGALEIIDEHCGVLVPANDRVAFQEVLGQMLADPALRRLAGSGGPERARRLCDPASRLRDMQMALESLTLQGSVSSL
jgi:glycosyltransferase involved in cell wall biosynthesis